MMRWLWLVLLVATPGLAREKLFILSPKGDDVDGRSRQIIEQTLVQVAADDGYDALSSADIAALLDIEAERQLAGCDPSSSCLSDIAGGVGANLVVSSTVVAVGGKMILSLGLFDVREGRVVARTTGEARSPAELPAVTQLAMTHLLHGKPVWPGRAQIGGVVTMTAGTLAMVVGAVPLALAGVHALTVQEKARTAATDDAALRDLEAAYASYDVTRGHFNTWGWVTLAAGASVVVIGAAVFTAGVLAVE